MNRKLFACLLPLLFLLLTPAMAQEDDDEVWDVENEEELINKEYDHILKLHLLQFGSARLSHEKMRTERISNELGLSYVYRAYFRGDGWEMPEGVGAKGLEVRMSQRYYTSKKHRGSPFGFFHGPLFGYRFMVFEENVFGLPTQDPQDPDYRFVGRLYQNTLELGYHLGGQFKVGENFTFSVAGALTGRLKYVLAKGAGDLLTENIIGHSLVAEENSAIFIAPSPQLNLSVGYAF